MIVLIVQVLWLMIVLASLAVATIFLYTAVVDFTSSTVVCVFTEVIMNVFKATLENTPKIYLTTTNMNSSDVYD